MTFNIDVLITYFEVAAYGFGALFLVTKLVGGQMNAGTDVSIELKRQHDKSITTQDILSVPVKLKEERYRSRADQRCRS